MTDTLLDKHSLCSLVDMMHACLCASGHDDIIRIIDQLHAIVPYNAASVCRVGDHDDRTAFAVTVNHSYPRDWVDIYLQHGYHRIDPVTIMSGHADTPFRWSSAIRKAGSSPVDSREQQDFLSAAGDYGMREGVALACAGVRKAKGRRTLLSLETGATAPRPHWDEAIARILPHLHEAMDAIQDDRPEDRPTGRPKPVLTVREREVLKWVHEGKTAWETGVILSISERTVKFHLQGIYRKLDASNRPQAVARAMRLGLLD